MKDNRVSVWLRDTIWPSALGVSHEAGRHLLARRELEAVAARSGWEVVGFYEDAGISGAKGRDQRPGFDRLLKDATARKVNLIVAWSVDRLGRSLQDLVGSLNELQAVGCNLYQDQHALDTTITSGRAMYQMYDVFAEFERCMN